jgi:aminoglycoside N3'-acetyltransferase
MPATVFGIGNKTINKIFIHSSLLSVYWHLPGTGQTAVKRQKKIFRRTYTLVGKTENVTKMKTSVRYLYVLEANKMENGIESRV